MLLSASDARAPVLCHRILKLMEVYPLIAAKRLAC